MSLFETPLYTIDLCPLPLCEQSQPSQSLHTTRQNLHGPQPHPGPQALRDWRGSVDA